MSEIEFAHNWLSFNKIILCISIYFTAYHFCYCSAPSFSLTITADKPVVQALKYSDTLCWLDVQFNVAIHLASGTDCSWDSGDCCNLIFAGLSNELGEGEDNSWKLSLSMYYY